MDEKKASHKGPVTPQKGEGEGGAQLNQQRPMKKQKFFSAQRYNDRIPMHQNPKTGQETKEEQVSPRKSLLSLSTSQTKLGTVQARFCLLNCLSSQKAFVRCNQLKNKVLSLTSYVSNCTWFGDHLTPQISSQNQRHGICPIPAHGI